jgi:hypothetical protein
MPPFNWPPYIESFSGFRERRHVIVDCLVETERDIISFGALADLVRTGRPWQMPSPVAFASTKSTLAAT